MYNVHSSHPAIKFYQKKKKNLITLILGDTPTINSQSDHKPVSNR